MASNNNNNSLFKVNSPNVKYTDDAIFSQYRYQNQIVEEDSTGCLTVTPTETTFMFKTSTKLPKLGVMIVGLGGNNGSTITGAIIANRENITWRKTSKVQTPNYFGSLTQASTLRLGADANGKDVYIPFSRILPMVHPNDIVIGGWDINNANLADAMERAEVFDWDLQQQLRPYMEKMIPLPSVYYPDFIAANQQGRANNLLQGTKKENVEQLRNHIRDFKKQTGVDKVIVCWSANTERYAELIDGVNDTADNLMKAIAASHPEVSPSTVFAVACILEGVPFINGSPQNTFVPGVIQLAESYKVFIGGDDFKSGQTKIKSVLTDFLVGAGIKPLAVTSYNHLGNNDGKNLSSASQFRSKEISKSNVIDDMVESNSILYKKGEHPDHTVVIKYVKSVGDSKRALDEYYSEIFMGGRNTIAIHNTCEDSLLAAPLILDLVILTELISRITFKKVQDANMVGLEIGEEAARKGEMETFYPILSLLSYLLKAPLVKPGAPVVNALFRQRMALENVFRACVGLAPQNEMLLEHRMWSAPRSQQQKAQVQLPSEMKERSRTIDNSDHGNRSKFVKERKTVELDNVSKNC